MTAPTITPASCRVPLAPTDRRVDARRRTVVSIVALCGALVDGLALSTVVLHATTHLGMTSASVGAILAAAGVAALISAAPLGALADRVGLRTAALVYGLGTAAALAGYAAADSLLEYGSAAICFAVSQAAAGSVRHALAVTGARPALRLGIRASMHTLVNIGVGLGTVVGGVVAVVGSDAAFRGAYTIAAAIAVLTAAAILLLPMPTTPHHSPGSPRGVLAALRDRRFAITTVLASAVQLTMPLLSVLIPVWVLTNTQAPAWVPSCALAVNTALVIGGQKLWAARVITPGAAAWSARIAAATLLISCALFAVPAAELAPASVTGLVMVAVTFLTVGEIAGGTATWFVALGDVPADAEGRYQAAFSMSSSAARIVGPGLALPLVTGVAVGGWIVLGALMAAACLGVAALAQPHRTLSSAGGSTPRLRG